MNNYREILISLLKSAIVAAPVLAIGFFIMFGGFSSGDIFTGASRGFFGCAAIIAGAIILAFPLARLIAEPTRSLFYPGEQFDRPQPVYSIPQSKRAKGFYEEAIAGYEKIAAEHPDEVKPYIEMIDIAVVNLKDAKRANTIYKRGMFLLNKDADKQVLAQMYSAIRSRLNIQMPGTGEVEE